MTALLEMPKLIAKTIEVGFEDRPLISLKALGQRLAVTNSLAYSGYLFFPFSKIEQPQ